MSVVGRAAAAQLTRGGRRFGSKGPKYGNKHYNKGNGGWKGGFVSKRGNFIKDATKMRYLQVPDLSDFKLTPYVARDTPKITVAPPELPRV